MLYNFVCSRVVEEGRPFCSPQFPTLSVIVVHHSVFVSDVNYFGHVVIRVLRTIQYCDERSHRDFIIDVLSDELVELNVCGLPVQDKELGLPCCLSLFDYLRIPGIGVFTVNLLAANGNLSVKLFLTALFCVPSKPLKSKGKRCTISSSMIRVGYMDVNAISLLTCVV